MLNFNDIDKEILKFWDEKKIFEKLRKKNKGKKKFSFLDGPITANNPMGVHHAWGRTYKDLFQRFKAMQGYDQRYQNGFDCQGLWVEREEEKDLGLKNKADIERFGILKFVQACRARVEKFSKIQRDQSIKLGMWMDWDNSYYTMSDTNNLHNWHLIKKYHDNGWLYKGKDAVPWCPRCGTASSKHDIATEGYREITHTALYMQLPVVGEDNTYFLVFTTTPWTIPANVALAVNANIDYVKVENDGLYYWLAESRLLELEGKYKILKKKKGTELAGLNYVMPYQNLEPQKDAPHKVVLWDLASGEEGTGIVHIAPGCGAEDFALGKKEGFPAISPLDDAGIYKEGYETFSGKRYNKVTEEVLQDLEQRRFVYKTKPIKHRYPHCWRCGEELVFRLVDEWYVKCKEMREKLISENKKITWFPEYGKKRQEEWFKNMSDWLISRKRYWGLPLPIWECSCGKVEVFGSLEELKERAIDKKKVDDLPEMHRPWIDEIKIKCSACKKEVERIKDVGDAWLDAGIVPFSTMNYLADKKYWSEWFPHDFICENMPGQYRGWFNALMWASVALTGKAPFKKILGFETLKDEKGEEMHKSKGNTIWFDDAVEKMGADPMRLLYCLQDPTLEMRFGFNIVKDTKNSLNILYNLSKLVEPVGEIKSPDSVEDKWILSKLNSLVDKVTIELEDLHPHLAARALQEFWLNDLSRGYVQFVRDRISDDDEDVKKVLRKVYLTLLKLSAPMIPLITENLWQKIGEKDSVHLADWPKTEKEFIDEKIEKEISVAREIVEKGMALRDKEKIGLKWPLLKASVRSPEKIDADISTLIAKQLNVKKIEWKKSESIDVEIDTKITLELEAEGFAREIARKIQAERKESGLQKSNTIKLSLLSDDEMKKLLDKHVDFIKQRTNSSEVHFVKNKEGMKMFEIKGKNFGIKFALVD